jgi:hypothetical protein
MIEKLSVHDRARLHRFLQDHFNLIELKDLAFVLGVDHECLPVPTENSIRLVIIDVNTFGC